jgi:hypothetical protein
MNGREFMKVVGRSGVMHCEGGFCIECEVSGKQQQYTLKPPFKVSLESSGYVHESEEILSGGNLTLCVNWLTFIKIEHYRRQTLKVDIKWGFHCTRKYVVDFL